MLKKILKSLALILGIFILFALAAPFLFKKQLVGALKKELNSQLTAQVDFADLDLSFFRRFPKVSVAVQGLQVVGSEAFAGDTLVSVQRVEAALDFWSVVRGSDYKVYSVGLDAPRINAIVLKDGRANWDILKPDSSDADPSAPASYTLRLTKYSVSNADVRYSDESAGIYTHVSGLDHEGSGDFTSEKFTLKTKTKAGGLTVRYGAIPYLSEVATTVDADLEIDNKTSTYTFSNGAIRINALDLVTNGFVQLLTDSTYKMDLSLKAPSTTFREVLSLIPALYKKDFDKIKTAGNAKFEGFVKGVYGPQSLPAFSVNLDVANGSFQYPDLPQPVKNINLALQVDNPDGVTDHTTVRLPQAHFEMGGAPIDGHLLLTQPVSAMNIDAAVKGRLDLAQLGRMVKLDEGTRLAGIALADITMKGSVAALQAKRYDGFNAGGTLRLDAFNYASKDYPAGVALQTLLATFNPRNITLSQLAGRYGKTNFTASGTLDNVLAYALKGDALAGRMQLKADAINLDEFVPVSADTAAASSAAMKPFLVPANLDLGLTAVVDAVHYDKVDLKGLSGSLLVKNETVFMNDVKAAALDGNIRINGSYSTLKDKKHPDISFTYDVQGLDVQKTFLAFNTVQKLMPIARFMGGKLSSQMTVDGKLGAGMMPELNSLTGKGNLLLIEGVLQKFAPVDKLANTLQIAQLQNISLRDVRNYFEFANGKVLVKPFTIKIADMELEAGGLHGFDQSLDYVLNLKVPRAKLGASANNFVNGLAAQAVSRGLPVKLGDIVNLKVNMGGTISNPQVRTMLKESAASLTEDLKKQATDFVQNKVDSGRKLLRDTVTAVKKQLIENAKNELLKKLGGGSSTDTSGTKPPPEDIKKKVENTGKSLLNNLFGKKEKKDSSK